MAYRLRVRDDAGGFFRRYAGQWASAGTWPSRDDLQKLVDAMPNGRYVEIIEVSGEHR